MEAWVVDRARALRRDATVAERMLWQLVRDRQIAGAKFRRQHPVGPFIADFACVHAKLIVEADGGQHAESAGDARRTAWLEAHGWVVCRFWNNEVLENSEGVVFNIQRALLRRAPSPSQR